jgi:hypothetical protein
LAPRHPPSALCSLTTTATHQEVSCRVARDTPCTQLGEIEDLQSAETYPVVKVRPCGLERTSVRLAASSVPLQRSAGRWVLPTDQRSDVGLDTKRRLDLAEPPYRQRSRSSSLGLLAPIFTFCQVPVEAVVFPPGPSRVVETRRLELLTLSLQRRCSAN